MRSFLRRHSITRHPALPALALAALLAACAMPANGGFVQARPDAQAFDQARATCWERAMGANGGGSSQFGNQMAGYDSCMARAGWDRPKSAF